MSVKKRVNQPKTSTQMFVRRKLQLFNTYGTVAPMLCIRFFFSDQELAARVISIVVSPMNVKKVAIKFLYEIEHMLRLIYDIFKEALIEYLI